MRTVTVITGARSDYGIYRPILQRIAAHPALRLELMVTGMHLTPEYGLTVRQIEQDGYTIRDRIECLTAADTPNAIAQAMGLALIGFAQAFSRQRPELLLALGDRFEMLAAVQAAMPFKIPVAHLHGGESTEGLIDEPIRHSITKLSHYHFASTRTYADRIIQMGESPARVFVSGAPSLDNLRSVTLLSTEELRKRHGLVISEPPLLVTFHPVTLEYEQAARQIDDVLAAIEATGQPVIFTFPNADTSGRIIIQRIEQFVAAHPQAQVAVNLGTQGYFSAMRHAAAMVGNSSSGIIEAASFELPVVNIGNRQRGRVHAENVLDCECHRDEILHAIQRAASPEFRASLSGLVNPYGDGHAAERIVDVLASARLDDGVILKRFHDLPRLRAA
uniref:UDP-N-acetylglucosamine 2-epimerase (Hydrolyzing) n=1 Tax=Schlesneria paludicola TaxID=360056 RepID=A0A7C2JWS8_9PLAN